MKIKLYNTKFNEHHHPKLVCESTRTYHSEEAIGNAEVATTAFRRLFHPERLCDEHVFMLALDSESNILAAFDVSHGTVDKTLAIPADIITRALLAGSRRIIVAHNHPSGSCTPSNEDRNMTARLGEALDLVGILLLDHIILGRDDYFSMRALLEEIKKEKAS